MILMELNELFQNMYSIDVLGKTLAGLGSRIKPFALTMKLSVSIMFVRKVSIKKAF